MLSQEIESQPDDALELGFIGDEMVGGGDHDVSLGAVTMDMIAGVGDARRGVATRGFAKYLVGAKHGQLFQHQLLIGGVGHHQEIAVGDDGTETFVGALDEALSCSEDV